jgi:hypothetical protein
MKPMASVRRRSESFTTASGSKVLTRSAKTAARAS